MRIPSRFVGQLGETHPLGPRCSALPPLSETALQIRARAGPLPSSFAALARPQPSTERPSSAAITRRKGRRDGSWMGSASSDVRSKPLLSPKVELCLRPARLTSFRRPRVVLPRGLLLVGRAVQAYEAQARRVFRVQRDGQAGRLVSSRSAAKRKDS
jgi:hypothetical protein